MNRMVQLVAVAALLMPWTATAQNKVDFAGTWTMDASRSQSALPGTGATPVRQAQMVIAQVGGQLVVETMRDGNRQIARFPLIDPELPKAVGTSGSAGVGTIGNWGDRELTTSTPLSVNGMAVTTMEKRTLSPDGREMTVETVVTVEHGYEGKGINYSSPVKDVYVKTAK
jgi:hypothetical protein